MNAARVRRKTLIALAAAAASVPLLGVASPASAAAAYTCPRNAVCVYEDANYGGGHYTWLQGDVDSNFNTSSPITFNNGHKVNDHISSLKLTSSHPVQFCTDANQKGVCDRFYGPGQVPSNPGGHGDQYSSMHFNFS